MQQHNNLFEYWDNALQQETLHKLNGAAISSVGQRITRSECTDGRLMQSELLATLLAAGSRIVIIPYYAQMQQEYFFPLVLVAELNSSGNFIAIKSEALPIIPQAVLEPAELAPLVLGTAQDYENFMIMQPAVWLEDDVGINWQQQLAYATQVLDAVNNTWRNQLVQLQYILQNDAIIIPLSALHQTPTMDLSILNHPKNLEIIEAPRNSGKSNFAKKLIIKAWLEAAIKHQAAPRYVWLEHNKPLRYAKVFDFATINAANLQIDAACDAMVAAYNVYKQGKNLLTNWQQVTHGMQHKYSDKGDIYARLKQLHKNLKEIKSQQRHLEVLNSIWLRQVELAAGWSSMLDFIPFLQTRRLKRLYLFFKQNFPQDVVTGFSERQLQHLFLEKVRRVANSERFVADTLHQVETDLHQETIVSAKCLEWCKTQQLEAVSIENINEVINEQLWQNVTNTTSQYWQLYFAAKPQEQEFLATTPNSIDVLLVEHAEYVSPMLAAQLLSITKRCVVMGNAQPINAARFPVNIDYELTKHFNLAADEADFEDLQYAGQLGSTGNMWNLVLNENEVQQSFEALPQPELQYEFIDCAAGSAIYRGSRMNAATIELTLEWLRNNHSLIAKVAIYTCFSAQAAILRDVLQAHNFTKIPVYLVQSPNFNKHAISLFLPVYSAADAGPYVFDQGSEILDNLLANTTVHLVVIGDKRIFKPELHSAAGMFAKHFIPKEEVSCVAV